MNPSTRRHAHSAASSVTLSTRYLNGPKTRLRYDTVPSPFSDTVGAIVRICGNLPRRHPHAYCFLTQHPTLSQAIMNHLERRQLRSPTLILVTFDSLPADDPLGPLPLPVLRVPPLPALCLCAHDNSDPFRLQNKSV